MIVDVRDQNEISKFRAYLLTTNISEQSFLKLSQKINQAIQESNQVYTTDTYIVFSNSLKLYKKVEHVNV